MTSATLHQAGADAPRSPHGEVAIGYYEGRLGPAYAGYLDDDQLATRAWGPHLPDAYIGVGPYGRVDGKPIAFYHEPMPLRVGSLSGEAQRCDWALFNRRKRGIRVRLGPRSYLYRISGLLRPLLEREDRSPVVSLRGGAEKCEIAETADDVDLAVALLLFYCMPISAIKAQA